MSKLPTANDPDASARALVPRAEHKPVPAGERSLVRAARRALPVVGSAALLWAGRRVIDTLAARAARPARHESAPAHVREEPPAEAGAWVMVETHVSYRVRVTRTLTRQRPHRHDG